MSNIVKRIVRRYERKYNQRHSFDYPPTSGGFEKCSKNPVLFREDMGSLFDPFVRKVNDRYLMCVSDRKCRSIVLYSSFDGVEWELVTEALQGIPSSDWESTVNRGTFLYRNDVWYLYYTGQNGKKSCIGLATSQDGKTFVRCSSYPVLLPELSFEGKAVMNPCVIYDDEKELFRMWYAAGENYEPDVIAYAESKDGVNWEKRSSPVMTADKSVKYQQSKVGACDIVRLDDGRYCMAYIGYQNVDVARICFAFSDNGIDGWKKGMDNPVISPEKGKWDCNSVYKPTLCITEDSVYIWYNGRGKSSESIGFAYKKRVDAI